MNLLEVECGESGWDEEDITLVNGPSMGARSNKRTFLFRPTIAPSAELRPFAHVEVDTTPRRGDRDNSAGNLNLTKGHKGR